MRHCAIASEIRLAAGSDCFYEHEGDDRGDGSAVSLQYYGRDTALPSAHFG